MKKLIALLCLLSLPAWGQGSTAENIVLGSMTTTASSPVYPIWQPISSANPLHISTTGGGGGSSLTVTTTTTAGAANPTFATTSGTTTNLYIDPNFSINNGALSALSLTVSGNAALNGTTTISTAQILAGNALVTTITSTTDNTTTLNATNAALTGTTTANNLTVTGTCTGCGSGGNPGGSSVNAIQTRLTSSTFGGATGLFLSTTRQGLDYLSQVTTSNLISLGDNGLDSTSYAIGGSALLAQTSTGANNLAIGPNALAALTTGTNNVGIGSNAGSKIVTDSGNTAIGSGALQNMAIGNTTTLGANTAGGYQALSADTTGFENTAWGYQALTGNTTGLRNTALGYKAGSSNTTASDCVAVGSSSACSSQSVALGSGASTSAIGDIAIGFNESVTSNSSIGIGGNNAAAGGTVAVGSSATGGVAFNVVALGYQAANEGQWGIALGSNTGRTSISGAGNLLLGANVGASTLSTGSYNILIGTAPAAGVVDTALGTTSTSISIGCGKVGSFDTCVGFGALAAVTTNGLNSAAFGYDALNAVTTGIQNTAYGYRSDALVTTGTGNISMGYNTDSTVLTIGSNNIQIGNSLAVSTSSTSNTINLGGIYLATGTATATTATPTVHGTLSIPDIASSTAAQTGTLCWTTGGAVTYDPSLGCLTSLRENKKSIQPLTGALTEVLQLQPSTFYYNHPNITDADQQIGLIAQDAEMVDKKLVAYNQKDGKLAGVRYANLGVLDIAAIQDMQAEIAQLEAQIVALGGKPIIIPVAAPPPPSMMDSIKHAVGY